MKSYSWFFGPFLAALRRGSDLSQTDLAKVAGVPKSKISKVERQTQPVTFDDFLSIGVLLCGCPQDLLDFFLGYVVEARQTLYELEEAGMSDPRVSRAALDSVADKVVAEKQNQ